MFIRRRITTFILALLIASQGVAVYAQDPSPQSEGANGGPTTIVGQVDSASGLGVAALFPEPVVALIDSSGVIQSDWSFTDVSSQILGHLTSPFQPLPASYRIDLPYTPRGQTVDFDGDGAGVQVFTLIVSSNLTGDSYLQQMEQFGGFTSVLSNPETGVLTNGALLLYSEEAGQTFPVGFGEDGIWFTDDDELGPVEAGYSVANLSLDGVTNFDRSVEVTIDTLEPAEEASPDFSDQGILESFNSLIDLLSVRYAYTELRGLDWEQIRAEYLPAVEAADADQDFGSYFHLLENMTHSLRDAHVSVSTYNLDVLLAPNPSFDAVQANLGATVIAASDPDDVSAGPGAEIVVLTVGEDSPASDAGWVQGTKILSVDGKSPDERFAELPILVSKGTEETANAVKIGYFLNFAMDQQVTIEYQLPGDSEVQSVTLTAGAYDVGTPEYQPVAPALPVSLRATPGGQIIVKWSDFVSNLQTKISILEEAIEAANIQGAGLVLDLRGNSGGWEELEDVLASYFFTADDPLQTDFLDHVRFDAETGEFVTEFATPLNLSAPNPAFAYTGPLVILVDQNCVSACEYFTQTLQHFGRATVVGQYGTAGGGGNIAVVSMPADITLQYTAGRTAFAGTNDYNIEAKGVTPDVRVPVTVETEQAKLDGQDPILDAGLAEVQRQADEIAAAQAEEALATETAMAEMQGSPEAVGEPEVASPAAGD